MIPDLVEIVILLFADDGILVSDTVCGLQNQLNVLCNTGNHFGRVVYLEKSKKWWTYSFIFFFLSLFSDVALCEKWKYDDSPLKIVNIFKLLRSIRERDPRQYSLNCLMYRSSPCSVMVLKCGGLM